MSDCTSMIKHHLSMNMLTSDTNIELVMYNYMHTDIDKKSQKPHTTDDSLYDLEQNINRQNPRQAEMSDLTHYRRCKDGRAKTCKDGRGVVSK